MEGFFGILVIAVIAVISAIAKASQERQGQRRPPPGPWSGGPWAGPGMPGFPQPNFPQRGPQQAPPPPPPVPGQQAQTPAWSSVTTSEGVGVEGQAGEEGTEFEGVSSEGPGQGEDVAAEVNRLNRQVEELDREADQYAKTDVVNQQWETAPDVTGVTLAGSGELPDLVNRLNESNAFAQAILVAEVLGKPKALRTRGSRL